jgi:hypothetical protein
LLYQPLTVPLFSVTVEVRQGKGDLLMAQTPKQQAPAESLATRVLRAIKDNPALATLLGVLIPAVFTLVGVLIQQQANLNIAWQDLAQKQNELDEQQEAAEKTGVQKYLEDMGNLRREHGDDGATLAQDAQGKTWAVLVALAPEHKGSVVRYLHAGNWIPRDEPVVSLAGVDLRDADLSGAYLTGSGLRNAYLTDAKLSGAKLSGAELSGAELSGAADLSGADLSGEATLYYARLPGATLTGADLNRADLSWANLRDADLSGAKLSNADLSNADLTGATLTISNEELEQQAYSLEGTLMPNGLAHA